MNGPYACDFIICNCESEEQKRIIEHFPGCVIDTVDDKNIKINNPTQGEGQKEEIIIDIRDEKTVCYEKLIFKCGENEKLSDLLVVLLYLIAGFHYVEADYIDLLRIAGKNKTLVFYCVEEDVRKIDDRFWNTVLEIVQQWFDKSLHAPFFFCECGLPLSELKGKVMDRLQEKYHELDFFTVMGECVPQSKYCFFAFFARE